MEATLAKVTAFVFVVGYICSAVGFVPGISVAPSGIIVDDGSFLMQLVTTGRRAVWMDLYMARVCMDG